MQVALTRVEGLDETVAYLKRFDKEALKALNKELYAEMKGLVQTARSMVDDTAPMSGWAKKSLTGAEWGSRLLYTPSKVKTGLRSKIESVRRTDANTVERAYFLINANPAGMVYEWAGRKSRGTSKQGKQFIQNIEERSGIVVIGKQGRLAWKAVYENRAKVTASMAQVVARYVNWINGKLAA